MMDRYWTGMFILINKTMETKYIPMICDKKRTKKFELLGLEIQMKNFDMVKSKPRVDVNTIKPTKINEMCWDQKRTSISRPNQWTAISIPLKEEVKEYLIR